MFLVSDAGTINGYRVATIPLIRSQVVAFAIHPTDRSSPSCYVLRHSYGISLYLELAREHSIQHSIQCSTLRLIRCSIRHSIRSIGRVYPYLTLHHEPSSTNCLAMESLPFSLTRQDPLQRRIRVEYLLFDTRRVQTSKRLNLEA